MLIKQVFFMFIFYLILFFEIVIVIAESRLSVIIETLIILDIRNSLIGTKGPK